jgi:hypothetical protein
MLLLSCGIRVLFAKPEPEKHQENLSYHHETRNTVILPSSRKSGYSGVSRRLASLEAQG